MNTFSFWKDPRRRELVIAAAAGAVWALLGVAIAHGAQDQHAVARASCRIHNYLPTGAVNVGSGTLVDVTAGGAHGLVLSCAHLFTEGTGRIVVEFAGSRVHGANLIAIDRDADLSALEIATPPAPAALVSFAVDAAAPLTACGFGPSGHYRCIAGPVVGTASSPGQESIQIAGAVRSGDSGGGVFDPAGQLVGVVWGETGGVTYATSGGPLRRFVERVLGRREATSVAATCPNGMCPRVQPGVIGAAPPAHLPLAGGGVFGNGAVVGSGATPTCPCDCGGACVTQLATIADRINALEAGKQDRGDYLDRAALAPYARTDQLAVFERETRNRHESLLERVEGLGPLVAAAGRVAVPAATAALGISGPMGWGILAATTLGGWFIGRRLRQRGDDRRSRGEDRVTTPNAARSSSFAPSPEATAAADPSFRSDRLSVETLEPIERDDREARELLRLSQLEGRDPLQDALAGRLALDRLDAVAESDADPQRARLADDLRRELRERFNEIAPTKFEVPRPS